MTRHAAATAGWIVLALAATLAPLAAHHAFSSEFDAEKPVRLRGKITKMEWINPHAWMHIEVTAEDGSTENWMIEAGPPGNGIR